MKKSLIGLAGALACGTLLAQTGIRTGLVGTDLTIYGVADAYVAHYRTEGERKTEVGSGGSGGSRLGFLASRNLKSGFRVGARLEAGINIDTGRPSSTGGRTDRVWSRQAYLFTSSPAYGELRLGRLQGPAYDFMAYYDPMLMPTADSWGVVTTLGFPTPGTATGTGRPGGFFVNPTIRTENSIEYISPVFSGVQVKLAHSLAESVNTTPAITDLSVIYNRGPLSVGGLVLRAHSTAGAGPARPTASVTEAAVAASYDFGFVKPYVTLLRRNRTDPTIGLGGLVLNPNAERVNLFGAIVPVSAQGQVRATYGRYASGSANMDAKGMAVAYTHSFDESLMGYVAYSRLTQDSAARFPIYLSPVPQAGRSVDAFIVGATWRF